MKRAGLSVVLLVAGFIGGMFVTGWVRAAEMRRATDPAPAATAAPIPEQRAATTARPAAAPAPTFSGGGPDFTRVAGQAVKGVANISSLQVVRTRNAPFSNDPFFPYFFGDDDQFTRDRRSMSLGSGVIISADGYVITNNHVVGEHVSEITTLLPDKREIKGKGVGPHPPPDVAVLKIPATGLPVIAWGDSSQVKVGEWAREPGSACELR